MRIFATPKLFFSVLPLILLGSLISPTAIAQEKTLSIPLNFFIITQLSIPKGSYHLTSWLQEDQIRKIILPEINRIWKPANIEFFANIVLTRAALNPDSKKDIIDYLANAQRDDTGKSDPHRIKLLSELIDFQDEIPKSLNIYLVPYLGEASQGHAKRKLKRAFITQWTDKPSKGQRNPERFKLVEKGNFMEGSMARTIAHEIGHLLKLEHPDKQSQTVFNRLMGGKNPGYDLTQEEIKLARKYALKLDN
jgi:hypothetical protein